MGIANSLHTFRDCKANTFHIDSMVHNARAENCDVFRQEDLLGSANLKAPAAVLQIGKIPLTQVDFF